MYKNLNAVHSVSTGDFIVLYTQRERQLQLFFIIEKDVAYYKIK